MRGKLLAILFGGILILGACSEDGDVGEASSEELNTDADVEVVEEEESMEPGDSKVAEIGEVTIDTLWQEGETFESGPIVLSIDKVFVASGKLEGAIADIMETDEVEYIQVDLSVENTSDKDVIFIAGQNKVTTNTGEQMRPDMWLSGYIEGEMMAGTKASDSFIYILENSTVDEIESIHMELFAPNDAETAEFIGEDIEFEIKLK